MNKTLLSLAFAGTFAAGLAIAGTASAQIVTSDLGYQNADQPSLILVRGGGADRQDPFKELRERRQQQQSQKDKAKESTSQKDKDSQGGFFSLFDS